MANDAWEISEVVIALVIGGLSVIHMLTWFLVYFLYIRPMEMRYRKMQYIVRVQHTINMRCRNISKGNWKTVTIRDMVKTWRDDAKVSSQFDDTGINDIVRRSVENCVAEERERRLELAGTV